jgi:hypothetical protein
MIITRNPEARLIFLVDHTEELSEKDSAICLADLHCLLVRLVGYQCRLVRDCQRKHCF